MTGIPITLADPEGRILLSCGPEDVCRLFHWNHPATAARCRQCQALDRGQAAGGAELFRCANGLWDIAMALRFEGELLATLYMSPFFLEDAPPDPAPFEARARELGFDPARLLRSRPCGSE